MSQTPHQAHILDEVLKLPDDWHGAGTFQPEILSAIVRHASQCEIHSSVEMGSGKSTLLFSHLNQFTDKLQLALLDGPHAFPYPALEYYYIYPHLADGALLIVDDINVPTINQMFEFLSADQMFELLEVVGKSAFFRRTAEPTFDKFGDGWWLQEFNRFDGEHYSDVG